MQSEAGDGQSGQPCANVARMRFVTPHFAFDVPEGFTENLEATSCHSFVREADLVEVTVSTFVSGGDPLDDTLRYLSEQHRKAFERLGEAPAVSSLKLETRGTYRIAHFLAVGMNPILSFCAKVTPERLERGKRCIVAFSVYQQFAPGRPQPTIEAFTQLAWSLLMTLEPRLPLDA
jgi:hypothetical protein